MGDISAPMKFKTNLGMITCANPEKMVISEIKTMNSVRFFLRRFMVSSCKLYLVSLLLSGSVVLFGFGNKEVHGDAPHDGKDYPSNVIEEHPFPKQFLQQIFIHYSSNQLIVHILYIGLLHHHRNQKTRNPG